MKRVLLPILLLAVAVVLADLIWQARRPLQKGEGDVAPAPPEPYSGSSACRPCHGRFYRLWSGSRHGLAMQPFTPELAAAAFTPQEEEIEVEGRRYRADPGRGVIRERGPDGEAIHPIQHVLGGKNVFYLLTPLERGRLQVLPVAYDVRAGEWFDTAASAMRHLQPRETEVIGWRETGFTFNTSCRDCHVSQLRTGYDLATDTYATTWSEPGINCESCHGPATEHIRVCQEAGEGNVPQDLRLIRPQSFTPAQHNDACASCHAKRMDIGSDYAPGNRFFDHHDLVCLEHPDFYPDGRDLGENFTFTTWRMNPCARAGPLHCLHCHTSSGRYRFQGEEANSACLPCHEERVRNAEAHTRHPPGTPGGRCVDCHMPVTTFARMRRSDHSLRPPMPAATQAFGSPNACNLCHPDRDAAWADGLVREWRERDFQAPVLHWGGLVAAARQGDWTRLPEMLAYVDHAGQEEVVVTSLVRLLSGCADPRKWPVLRRALAHRSPLVRGAAAAELGGNLTPESVEALLAATGDEYRLVRARAAGSLASVPRAGMDPATQAHLEAATEELEDSLRNRPDDWASHYNLGNLLQARGDLPGAIEAFETAIRLEPLSVPPLVNLAMAHAMLGQSGPAEARLRQALELQADSVAANLNLGLLLGERGAANEAETCLRRALAADPDLAVAAYNLAVLRAGEDLDEAVELLARAVAARPDLPRYGTALAFYLMQAGRSDEAVAALQALIGQHPEHVDGYLLLTRILAEQEKLDQARALLRRALTVPGLGGGDRLRLEDALHSLPPR